MWQEEIELVRMSYVRSGWAYHQWWAGDGINSWWEKKKMTHSIGKENIQNVKHSDVFTHFSVIQIFRLRPRPDVHQIPSNPRGMVWPNLPQSMWPRLESGGGGEGMCGCVCVCFAFQTVKPKCCLMQLHFKNDTRLFHTGGQRLPSGENRRTINIC